MKDLQIEHRKWLAKKYPNQTPKIPAVGCLEEAGELVHAILKMEMIHTWGEDMRHRLPELRVKLTDAIGDCGIFACSLCNANEWDFDELWHSAAWNTSYDAVDTAIMLVDAATQVAMYPSNFSHLWEYLARLKEAARILGIDAETAVRTTWETVKCR